MKSVATNEAVLDFDLQFKLRHYETTAEVTWHAALVLTTLDDDDFSSPLLSKDTSVSTTGWFYRDDSSTSTGQSFVAFPSDGVDTELTNGEPDRIMGTVMYVLTASEKQSIARGRKYLMRCRLHNGSTWGSWYVTVITVV